MIGGEEIYGVVTAMLPLYTAILLGYGSVKWWQMFKSEHCDAINRFNCYFILPFFIFEFVARVDPYTMNFRFLAADVIAKLIIAVLLVLWANFSSKGSFCWSITTFSLSSITNTLVVGVPLLQAMYGDEGSNLVVQSSVIQSLLWLICLLFMLELRRAKSVANESESQKDIEVEAIEMEADSTEANNSNVTTKPGSHPRVACKPLRFWAIMKIVWVKLAKNPNSYACILGLVWALVANRWHFGMPKIIEGSILIMSRAGAGLCMFSIGLFMALQEKIIACGMGLTLYAMVWRFVIGPATTAIGAFATGLHGNVLRIVIIQAGLPQAVTAFVFAQEYGLHAQVLSTAVIFGTVVSLPLLMGYYAVLDVWH